MASAIVTWECRCCQNAPRWANTGSSARQQCVHFSVHCPSVFCDIEHTSKLFSKILGWLVAHLSPKTAYNTLYDLFPLFVIRIVTKNMVAAILRTGPIQATAWPRYIITADGQDISLPRGNRGADLTSELT